MTDAREIRVEIRRTYTALTFRELCRIFPPEARKRLPRASIGTRDIPDPYGRGVERRSLIPESSVPPVGVGVRVEDVQSYPTAAPTFLRRSKSAPF